MEQQEPMGCGVAFVTLFGCVAVFVIILLTILGPAIGNVFSEVIDGLNAP